MKLLLVLPISLLALSGVQTLFAQAPQMSAVQPRSGKIGAVLSVKGVYLDKTRVDEVYLTDHALDMKVKVLDQTGEYIKFRIPPSVKPGRLQLVVKTAGKQCKLLEQPVYVTVEEDLKEPTEVAAASH
jgi:hypothetical protein